MIFYKTNDGKLVNLKKVETIFKGRQRYDEQKPTITFQHHMVGGYCFDGTYGGIDTDMNNTIEIFKNDELRDAAYEQLCKALKPYML